MNDEGVHVVEFREYQKFMFKLPQRMEHMDRIRIEGEIMPNAESFTVNFIEERDDGELSGYEILFQLAARGEGDKTTIYARKALHKYFVKTDEIPGWPPTTYFNKSFFNFTFEIRQEGWDVFIVTYFDSGRLPDISIAKTKLARGAISKIGYLSVGADVKSVTLLNFYYLLDKYHESTSPNNKIRPITEVVDNKV